VCPTLKYNLEKLIELISNDEYNIPDPIIDHILNMKAELRRELKKLQESGASDMLAENIYQEILGE